MHLKPVLILMIAILLSSCDSRLISESPREEFTLREEQSYVGSEIEFAKALSRSISSSTELKNHLWAAAEKQFDKNYDVLYHQVKKVFNIGGSFKINQSNKGSKDYHFTEKYKDENDNLGTFNIYFTDPIVINSVGDKVSHYNISTGSIEVSIIPRRNNR